MCMHMEDRYVSFVVNYNLIASCNIIDNYINCPIFRIAACLINFLRIISENDSRQPNLMYTRSSGILYYPEIW